MVFITQEQMAGIKKGRVPRKMEDKWFMYYSNSCLHVHRSWTGNAIFIVRFNEEGDEATTVDFQANRDSEQYRETDNVRDIQTLTMLIASLTYRPSFARQCCFQLLLKCLCM